MRVSNHRSGAQPSKLVAGAKHRLQHPSVRIDDFMNHMRGLGSTRLCSEDQLNRLVFPCEDTRRYREDHAKSTASDPARGEEAASYWGGRAVNPPRPVHKVALPLSICRQSGRSERRNGPCGNTCDIVDGELVGLSTCSWVSSSGCSGGPLSTQRADSTPTAAYANALKTSASHVNMKNKKARSFS